MYKKIFLILGIVGALVFFTGCDSKISGGNYDDLLGTWVFPPYGQDSPFIMVQEDTGNKTLIISWYLGTDKYFCNVEGTYDSCEFTGTYDYELLDNNSIPIESGRDQSISVVLTISSDKLKIVCTGEGPLDGKTYEEGILSP
jgi:hypothetical protein